MHLVSSVSDKPTYKRLILKPLLLDYMNLADPTNGKGDEAEHENFFKMFILLFGRKLINRYTD